MCEGPFRIDLDGLSTIDLEEERHFTKYDLVLELEGTSPLEEE